VSHLAIPSRRDLRNNPCGGQVILSAFRSPTLLVIASGAGAATGFGFSAEGQARRCDRPDDRVSSISKVWVSAIETLV